MNYSRSIGHAHTLARKESIQDNNDSLLDQSSNFDLQNQIYELTSKCNSIEYQKNKMMMSYQNALRQLKHKNGILQKLCQQNQQRQQNLKHDINQLHAQCSYLSEENQTLKKDLYSMLEKNRTTPDFTNAEFAQDINIFNELVKKEERIQQLDKELQQAKEFEYRDLRDRINLLEKENKKVKEQNLILQAETRKIERQPRQSDQFIIKSKDPTIQQLKKEKEALLLQLEEARKNRNSIKTQEAYMERLKDQRIAQFEEIVMNQEKSIQKIQLQKMKVVEQNQRLQKELSQIQKAKKAYQQQAQNLTIQLSQVRALSFNDKIESKRQVNSIKMEMEDEKNKLRTLNDQRIQQSRKLRDAILLLNDQNQELREKLGAQAKHIEKLSHQNKLLQGENERYLRESKKWQAFADQSNKKIQKNSEESKKIADLQQRLSLALKESNQKGSKIKQLAQKLQGLKEQVQNKDQIIEIMKIQKKQYEDTLKSQKKMIKELQQVKAQKEKVIGQLQQEIRNLKDDVRHLQLANQQANQKLQTLRNINIDIEKIKKQLELERNYYQQMRQEQQDLRRKHQKSEQFKQKHQASRDTDHNQREQLIRQLQALKASNQRLHLKLSQAESQIDRKGIDINVKQEQIRKLKQGLNNPRDVIFQPLIETTKRNQFNAVFLQNKILLLEKQITGLKGIKQKEFEEYKKAYRKNIQEKYLAQLKKSASYTNQLQKNIQLLNHKIHQQKQTNQQLNERLQGLTKDNYHLKYQYSETLQELNSILQKYKVLQTHCKDLEFEKGQTKKIIDENNSLKGYLDKLHRNHQEKLGRLSNANQQIERLNETLMNKQAEIRSLKGKSPNSSFIGSQKGQQKSMGNINPQYSTEHQPSSDGDSLRSWIKKSPNYSRV